MLPSILFTALLTSFAIAQTQDAPVITNEVAGASYRAIMQSGKEPQGYIDGVSNANGTGVSFNINFYNFPTDQGPFLYHIHELPVNSEGNCTSTGPHLDPYNRTEVPPCKASMEQTCQLGDLSGKHGNITDSDGSFQTVISDLYLSTEPGSVAFFGNRSVVIHNSTGARIQCGNFILQGTTTATTSSSAAASSTYGATSASSVASSASPSGIFNSGNVAKMNGGALAGAVIVAWAFL